MVLKLSSSGRVATFGNQQAATPQLQSYRRLRHLVKRKIMMTLDGKRNCPTDPRPEQRRQALETRPQRSKSDLSPNTDRLENSAEPQSFQSLSPWEETPCALSRLPPPWSRGQVGEAGVLRIGLGLHMTRADGASPAFDGMRPTMELAGREPDQFTPRGRGEVAGHGTTYFCLTI